jgi:signal transduction histidine kinase
LTEAIRLIALATGWDYGEVWAVSEDRTEVRPAAVWLRPGSGLEEFAGTARGRRHGRGESLPGRAWAAGRPIWEHDVTALSGAEFCRRTEAVTAGLRAAAALPIVSEGEVIAVLLFLVREARREDVHLIELVRAAVAPLGTLIQRKRAEGELAEYRRRLEEKVEARTAQLSESQEKLRIADRLASIGTLAAGLGHDMNNVLLPVRAHLNALRAGVAKGEIAAQAARHVEAIHKSAAYLQQLADGLHYLAVDPDKEDPSASATDLAPWWSQAGVLIAKAVPKHVRVKASIAPGLPKVALPAASLTQAVLNLVVNAGEAIPPGRKRVQGNVRISARIRDGAVVRLSVADNGTGMTEEVQRRAFELFFTTKPRGLGTGLGLALVRKVVEGAGGSIQVESKTGVGTTVCLDLPAAADTPPPVTAARTAVISIADGRAAGLVRLVLEASGAAAATADEPGDADLWIVEPLDRALPAARQWRSRRPGGRLVLFGPPGDDAPWVSLRPLTIERPHDFEAVRSVIGHALAPQ